MTPIPRRIGIMAAMPEELQALLDAMPDEAMERRAGREFWVGHLHGHEVVAVLSRIGKVAAATTTTVLLSTYGVDQILFIGVAGGLGEGVRVGDVVVADALLQHDMDASPLFPRFELPGLGVRVLSPPADLTERVHRTVENTLGPQMLADIDLSSLGLGRPRVHRGMIVSGDQFIHDAATCEALKRALPEALAVEMEGAAVAQVCHDFGVPYAVIRTISDRADDAAAVDFPRFIDTVARRYCRAVIEALLRSEG